MLHVNGDIYSDKSDISDLIVDLIALKEKVEAIEDASVIDRAVDVLYDVIEAGGNEE